MVFSYLPNIQYRPCLYMDKQTVWIICRCVYPYSHPTAPVQATPAVDVNIFNHYNLFLSHFLNFMTTFGPFFPLRCSGPWIGRSVSQFFELFSQSHSVWGPDCASQCARRFWKMETPFALTLSSLWGLGGVGIAQNTILHILSASEC